MLKTCPSSQGCQTGSHQPGPHPEFIENSRVCQMGRNSILERAPRKCLKLVMLPYFKDTQCHGPRALSLRPMCALQGVWEPHMRAVHS